MSHSVSKVARIGGVTIRTLHHYGDIGLLTPSDRTDAGYRVYTDADLDRLTRILFYRELGFSLDAIGALLDDETAAPIDHLRRQHQLLQERLANVQAMVDAVEREIGAHMSGIKLTSEEKLEVFGSTYQESWEQEAEPRWGGTDAWKQSQERTARLTRDDWKDVAARTAAVQDRIVAVYNAGHAPTSVPAMDIAEEHRQWVSTFWDCTYEAHRNLVEMYLADERFTKTYEDAAMGLTVWLRDAAFANVARHDQDSN